MKRKAARILYYALAVAGFVMMAAGCVGFSRAWLAAGIVLMVLCTLVNLKWNRCPHCGRPLGTWRSISSCPSCGEALTDAGAQKRDESPPEG